MLCMFFIVHEKLYTKNRFLIQTGFFSIFFKKPLDKKNFWCYNAVHISNKACLIGVSPSGKAPVFGTGIRGFESLYPIHRRFKFEYIYSGYNLISFKCRGIEQFGSSSGS